jgi:hypothetical protein
MITYSITNDGFAFDNVCVYEQPTPPDLKISTCNVNPNWVSPGEYVTASCDIKNQGEETAGSSVTKYYLSTDLSLSPDDTYLGYKSVSPIAGGVQVHIEKSLQIPYGIPDMFYYVLFFADANDDIEESDENNNWCDYRIYVMDFHKNTKLYPNPADNTITLELPVGDMEYHVSIFSEQGVKMIDLKTTQRILEIDVSDLLQGSYIVRVQIRCMSIIKQFEIIR